MPESTGSINAQGNIQSRDIITGLKIDNLTIVMNSLDELARLVSLPGHQLRLTPEGGLEARASTSGTPEVDKPDQPELLLPPNILEAFKQWPRATDRPLHERHRAYCAWLLTRIRHAQKPIQRVAAFKHWVPLKGTQGPAEATLTFTGYTFRPDGPPEARKLADVTEAVSQYPAFVLLGAPGSGKTTVLYRLEQEAARNFLTGQSRCVPLLVTLAAYHWEREDPPTFIKRQWAEQVGDDFLDVVRSGRAFLLIDGLNEMRRLQVYHEHQQRVNDWEHFLQQYFSERQSANRAVVASRTNDYEQTLDLPRVEIDPLDEEQIKQFLLAYLDDEADNALAAIERLDLMDLAQVPYSLFILTDLYDPERGDLPPNQGRLFAAYADKMLLNEKQHTDLPLDAARLALNELGYQMQQAGESTVLSGDRIEAMIPATVRLPNQRRPVETPAPAVFDLACRANLLGLDLSAGPANAYKFTHQLLQEQFAAADLLRRWQSNEDLNDLWRVPRAAADMPPADVGEWDPLPPPPPTGWEQTTLMASGLLPYADRLVQAVLTVNPALAGRCLSEGFAGVSDETRAIVQQALLQNMQDPALHRRARIQAGRVLGAVGDPRFTPVKVGKAEFILPDLIEIAGGTATLGSDDKEAYDDEKPPHPTEVATFYLARYPVTNAEYRCFVDAGGYDNKNYWTSTGWLWRQGELKDSGPVEDILQRRQTVLDNPGLVEQLFQEGRLTPEARDTWKNLAEMSEKEARQMVSGWYPVEAHELPYYWDNSAYNAANQPVVGVTWYEAMAYCAWLGERLAAQKEDLADLLSGGAWQVRLPTEAEWEWAAGGPEHRRYPWGDEFDVDKTNTLDGRVLGTTPVGAYPGGAATCGTLDMSGNVYEWIRSLYQEYPYRQDDGRENPLAEGRRALRGGSWNGSQRVARVSYRDFDHPVYFYSDLGFRVVVAPVIK